MLVVFLLYAWGCVASSVSMNTSNAVISLPAIVGESIYFSSVLEVGSNRNCSDHVVVFVMKPPRAEAHNESSAPPFGDRKRRRHRIADVSDDIDCLLSSTRFPSAYAVSPAVRIPGNKPYDYFDIIRCEVPDIISKGLPHNEKTLLVHLVSGKRGSLIQFILSVDTRSTGHMSTAFTSGPFTKRQPRGKNSSFFLLVPCVTDVFGVKLAVRIIEFLQHHISIGVSHVVMGFPFERQSRAMDLLMQYLLSFVKSGHLTIVPLIDTTNTVSKLSRTVGVLKYRSVSNLLFNNMCLYLTKGVADHIGIWDINSFLIPKAPITPGLSAFIKENSFHDGSSVNGDGSAHPNCQLSLSTRLLFDGRKSAPGEYTWWLGQRYGEEIIQHHRSSLLPGRPILATEVIYRVGLSGSAEACLLPREWTRCSQDQTGESPFLAKSSNKASHFCIDQPMRPSRRRARLSNLNKENEHHDFDSAVTYKDIHSVSPSMGYLMRFITNPPGPDRLSAVVPNEYRSHFYGVVLGALQDRGLDKVFLLPVDSVEIEVVAKSADRLWAPFVHNSERHAGGFLPSGQLAIPGVDKRSASAEKEKEETAVDGVTELPQYAKDNSEFFYGAIIERKSDSLDLHLTVFLVCPSMARTTHHVEALENTQKQKWKEYLLTNRRPQYELSGIRKQRYYCRIRNSEDLSAEQYLIPAHFMPNRLTPDSNANSNVDIMRCPMKNAADAYSRFAHTGHSVVVEILRDQDKNSLISFAVPWASRQTGYMLQSPSFATQLDPWLGADELLGTKETIPADLQYGKDRQAQRGGTSGRHDLYMCVPGMESPFDRRMLPLYMEFLEHHFQLGVKHIFLAATYTWGGENMKNLLGTVRSYIEDGMVSVVSNAVGVGASDCTYSFNGIALARDTVKVIFTNMCLYRAKGMADYVGIWDFDEFFIPRLPHNSIMDVVHALDTIKATQIINSRDKAELQHLAQSWRGAPGYADGDGHRNCYILLDSETITSAPEDRKESVWIGERFAHGSHKSSMSFQKPIFPTERIWQASLHVGGACALPMQWLHCTNESKAGSAARHQSPEFCYLPGDSMEQQSGVMVRRKGLLQTFSSFQAINEPLREHDAKRADINKDAIIYHIQAHRQYLKIEKDHAHLLQQTNEYSLRFFDSVYAGLVRRGIAVLQELPEIRPITLNSLDVVPWPSLSQTLPVKREPSAHLSSSHPLATLPAFSSDNSEFLFSAVIERASGINDLHITTFFLSHALMGMPHMKAMKINPSREKQWAELMAHAKQSKYTEDGVRITADEPFECKIRNTESGVSTVYSSRAEQIPNRLTPDSNANRRLDILRCKMLDSVTAYKSNAGRADNVVVELFRGSKLLIKFLIPWSARRVGHMVQSKGQTRLDPWTGSSVKDVPDRADLHMCVPGMESPPDKEMLPLYTEFVQHHASLGVQHFHIGTMFSWDSQPMHDLVQVLRPYILSGLVTITTQTDDYNMLYSTGGLTWSRDDSKIFFVNMCLYYAKGMADYVGIWDFDEFFIPRPPFNSIMDIVHSMEAKSSVDMEVAVSTLRGMSVDMAKKQYSSGPGLADGDAHPLCYILLLSECVHNHPEENMFNPSSPWIGQRYDHLPEQKSSHAFKKSILPTSKIFYAGLHMSGACKLPHPWNSCEKNDARDFCYSNRPRDYYGLSYTELDNKQVDFSFYQVFNGVVMDKDAKQMQVKSQGVIYHFQFHRQSMLASLFASRSTEKNEYALRFFPSVMEELQKRGITFIQNFPALVRRADNPLFGPLWTRAQKFFSEERV